MTRTRRRKSPVELLASEPFDLLVIGGGIVGAGVARDAAMRGLRTALVEQSDFAEGTSSRSTRLLHGGIRYLEQGRIFLVREANREKAVVHRIAPHLSQPMPFVFPARKGIGWPRWQLATGVKLYDLLCGRHKLGESCTLSAEATLAEVPGLSRTRLTGSVRYFDSFTNDARLVLDTLRSAATSGAAVCNYVRFNSAKRRGECWSAELVDTATDEPFTAEARCLVNAAGPWSDQIPGSTTSLRLTKGVHLVVDHARLPIESAVVAVEGARILFAIPWGERVVLGTTDTDYDGPLGEPACDLDDARYVLCAMNEEFPQAKLTTRNVISTWAGLRPLVADGGDPSDVSRRHDIANSQPGWWDVTGGKLTTYRLMAEETVDAVVRHLHMPVVQCQTGTIPLLDGAQSATACGVLPPPVSQPLVEHFCREEWARHLADVMIRRTSWRHYHRDHLQIAEQVVPWMQAALNWSDDVAAAELASYRKLVATQYADDFAATETASTA